MNSTRWSLLGISFFIVSCKIFADSSSDATEMLDKCKAKGWNEIKFNIEKLERRLLYKQPSGNWINGAIIVMHGGGGQAEHFCDDSVKLTRPQVRFTEMALQQNFAVFVLDSSSIVTDNDGFVCGKIWDDEPRNRVNLDLPYLKHILTSTIPGFRKNSDNKSIFVTGLSSGGYMSVRAATNLGALITAFAPISNGDPYGWHRKCDPKYGDRRENVKGAGFDNETKKEIIKENSCLSSVYPNEKIWDTFVGTKPKFRLFHSDKDGVNDYSCSLKVEKQLRAHGFSGDPTYLLKSDGGRRRLLNHFWHDEYNPVLLDFFKKNLE